MSHEAREALHRFRAGCSALVGTLTEMTGAAVARVTPLFPQVARGLNVVARILQNSGKLLGIAGAAVMAMWDFKRAGEARAKGQDGLAILYMSSGFLGLGAAIALAFAATGIGLALLAVVIVLAVIIEFVKNNKVQDWLERCLWGKGTQHYVSAEEELAQLNLALS